MEILHTDCHGNKYTAWMVEPCFYQLPEPSIKSIDGLQAKNFRLKLGATWGKTVKSEYRGEMQMVQPYSSMSFQDTAFEGLVKQMLSRAKLLEKMVDGTNPEFVFNPDDPLFIQK